MSILSGGKVTFQSYLTNWAVVLSLTRGSLTEVYGMCNVVSSKIGITFRSSVSHQELLCDSAIVHSCQNCSQEKVYYFATTL